MKNIIQIYTDKILHKVYLAKNELQDLKREESWINAQIIWKKGELEELRNSKTNEDLLKIKEQIRINNDRLSQLNQDIKQLRELKAELVESVGNIESLRGIKFLVEKQLTIEAKLKTDPVKDGI